MHLTCANRLDNADVVYVILISLVSNGVAMFVLAAFFKSFRKGFVVCRGLDANLSGKVAKKRL